MLHAQGEESLGMLDGSTIRWRKADVAEIVVGPHQGVPFRFRMRQVRTEVFEVDLLVMIPSDAHPGLRDEALAEADEAAAMETARRVAEDAHAWRKRDNCTEVDWDPVTITPVDDEGEDVGATEECLGPGRWSPT